MKKKFSIVKTIDMNKLRHEIYDYINDTGKEKFCLFMNEDTLTAISNEIEPSYKYNCSTLKGIMAAYCGFKIYSDNELKFGEVEIRE